MIFPLEIASQNIISSLLLEGPEMLIYERSSGDVWRGNLQFDLPANWHSIKVPELIVFVRNGSGCTARGGSRAGKVFV